MTSSLLYTLSQLGFKIDILQFGMNVTMDVINLASELADKATKGVDEDILDLSNPCDMEG